MLSRISQLAIFIALLVAFFASSSASAKTPVSLVVDQATRYQVMEGWGGSIGAIGIPVHEWTENPTAEFYDSTPIADPIPAGLKGEIADAAVATLGLNRFRLEVGPQVEMTPGEFRFKWQDFKVENWILPMKKRIEARGERMVLYVSYDLGSSYTPDWLLEPGNYSEMAVEVLTHLRDKYGLEPDYWSVLNEPGNHRPGDPATVARLIAATGRKIRDAGFATRISGPEVVTPRQAAGYLDAIEAEPAAADLLAQVTYHLYWDPANVKDRNRVRDYARGRGMTTAQTEWLEGLGLTAAEAIYLDLTEADVVSWEQYGIFFTANNYNRRGGGDYIVVDPGFRSFRVNTNAWYIGEYSRHVRPGDVRIGVSGGGRTIRPVAFERPDGSHTVVVINSSRLATDVEVTGLAPGSYSVGMTGPGGLGRTVGAVEVTTGAPLAYGIPGSTVVSFTGTGG